RAILAAGDARRRAGSLAGGLLDSGNLMGVGSFRDWQGRIDRARGQEICAGVLVWPRPAVLRLAVFACGRHCREPVHPTAARKARRSLLPGRRALALTPLATLHIVPGLSRLRGTAHGAMDSFCRGLLRNRM